MIDTKAVHHLSQGTSTVSSEVPERLVASGLVKSFRGRKVVKGVSLDVQAGEVVGLLGPNGAGKTTIFDMMVGLCQPDEGSIALSGSDITDLPMYRRARRGSVTFPRSPRCSVGFRWSTIFLRFWRCWDIPETSVRIESKRC